MDDEISGELPPSSFPYPTPFCVRGFTDAAAGERLANAVAATMHIVGTQIDLSTLDGVTIACDYDEALASLDRGVDGLKPLSRSNTEEMQGIAMSSAVMRDGNVRTHIVFDAAYVVSLILDDSTDEQIDLSNGLIAHECAHVDIIAEKERHLTGAGFGARIDGFEKAVMFQIAEVCWDEYAACRMSGAFNRGQSALHAETVIATVDNARPRSDAVIRAYRWHGNIDRLIEEAGPLLCNPMKAAAYLLGSMDAEEADWSSLPGVRDVLAQAGYLELVERLSAELRRLWDTRGAWEPGLAMFDELETIAHNVFQAGGLIFETSSDGACNLKVPFTPSTTPYGG